MKKRKFGMACLNITQGRYTGISHQYINAYDLAGMDTGIDRWRTWNDLEVIGVHPYSTTGFANTVHFYDAENDVTIAMTHCNVIPDSCVVGHVFHSGDTCYYEGTKGYAKGNHLHLEIGKGYQPSKVKAYSGGWGLKDFINIEDYFYIDREYTNINDDGGYSFSFTPDGESTMTFKDGYQEVQWFGNKVLVYKQTDDQDIGMISAAGGSTSLQCIDKIDDAREHWCKVNANYFQMQQGQSDPYGQHYGVEQTPQLNLVPRQNKNYLVVWVDNDNIIHYDYSDNYWLSAPGDVKFACTPAAVMLADGIDQDIISIGLGDKRSTLNSQTMLLQLEDGKYAFACTTNNNWNAYNCRNFAKYLGATFCALMDSGGSTQMIVKGDKTLYTGRAIANALTFYKKGTGSNVWGTESTKPSEGTNTPSDENEELQALQKELESLKSEMVELESKNEELNNQLGVANGRVSRLTNAIDAIAGIITELELELEEE